MLVCPSTEKKLLLTFSVTRDRLRAAHPPVSPAKLIACNTFYPMMFHVDKTQLDFFLYVKKHEPVCELKHQRVSSYTSWT